MGIEEIKNGRISRRRACFFRIKLKLPIEVTKRLRVSEIVGIARKLTLKIAINAVYDEPPPNPTDE
jgi:hypothetical protein